MKKYLVFAFALLITTLNARATTGICEGKALALVDLVANQSEAGLAKNLSRAPRRVKVEKVAFASIDAGDIFFETYRLQAFAWDGETSQWETLTRAPSQTVYGYEEAAESPEKSFCELSFFSFAGYTFGDFENLGRK